MKPKHIFLLTFLLLNLLPVTGCQSEPDTSVLAPSMSPTTAPTNTATITQTPTKRPTRTPKPTKTITLTPSATIDPRDFDASTIKTVTSAAPQQCPATNTSVEFDVEKLIEFRGDDEYQFAVDLNVGIIINNLNQGVPIDSINTALDENENYHYFARAFHMIDVTGDGINELVLPNHTWITVIGCKNQQYKRLGTLDTSGGMGMPISDLEISDLNNDGLNEIAFVSNGCYSSGCPYYAVFAWNGQEMVNISEVRCSTPYHHPFIVEYEDIDNNGVLDILLLHGGIRGYTYDDSIFPDRDETLICMWNGSQYTFVDYTYGEPVYRVQAYLDALYQSQKGNLDEALELYWRVIHDETLLWYTNDINQRTRNSWAIFMENLAKENPNIIYDPMYTQTGKRDIYEYPLLASASYYRMLLIYLDKDDIKNAETMLVILKDAYPPGAIGGYFTEMGEIIIKNYKETGDLVQSCPEVIKFSEENRSEIDGILTYLQITNMTRYDLHFNDESWCPYLPEGYGEE